LSLTHFHSTINLPLQTGREELMKKKRIIAILLIVFGILFLISAATFWIDTLTSSQPAGLGQNLRDWLTTIAGLGASIKGWIDLFKPEKTAQKADTSVNGGSPQIATGDHDQNIKAETYVAGNQIQNIYTGVVTNNSPHISRDRVLEATLQREVRVDTPVSLYVWIRRKKSKSIIHVLNLSDSDVFLTKAMRGRKIYI
jgi:hypothetical protein